MRYEDPPGVPKTAHFCRKLEVYRTEKLYQKLPGCGALNASVNGTEKYNWPVISRVAYGHVLSLKSEGRAYHKVHPRRGLERDPAFLFCRVRIRHPPQPVG